MKRQVVQTFLNLSGVQGLALMDGRTRPFYCGLDESLDINQQEVLSQGIQQVIKTTPAEFDSFAFRFSHHLAHIYKLEGEVVLLVLTDAHLELAEYTQAVGELKHTLAEDLHDAVATLRLLAGCVTRGGTGSTSSTAPPAPAPAPAPAPPAPRAPTVSYSDALDAVNSLSDIATKYLGKIMVANTWKSARPKQPWTERFEVQRNAHLALNTDHSALTTRPLSAEEQGWLQEWVAAFVRRCSFTIRDFSKVLGKDGLSPDQHRLLFKP